MRSFGLQTEARLIWVHGNDVLPDCASRAVWRYDPVFLPHRGVGLEAVYGNMEDVRVKRYRLREKEGFAPTLFNMVNQRFHADCAAGWGDLNGPTIGGIFTIVGFSATGKHLRNILPVMAGGFWEVL